MLLVLSGQLSSLHAACPLLPRVQPKAGKGPNLPLGRQNFAEPNKTDPGLLLTVILNDHLYPDSPTLTCDSEGF